MFLAPYLTVVVASVALTAPASAQLTLALDINGFQYAFVDSAGSARFDGARHTGVMEWSAASANARVVEARMGDSGPFGLLHEVELGARLVSLEGTVELHEGRVEGGSFIIKIDSGDSYAAEFSRGGLTALSSGGYVLDGLTFAGAFSDDDFGDIDVRAFSAMDLPGLAVVLRMDPMRSGDGTGNADLEVFVMVPLPPAAAAGLVTLTGMIGFTWLRRRRQGAFA